MKKAPQNSLLMLTLLFVALTLGFFLGRNLSHSNMPVTLVSNATTPAGVQKTAPPVQATEAIKATVPPPLININTATAGELESLPGIGPSLAQRIIAYREEFGPFTSVAQLTNIDGIGDAKLTAILDLITAE